MSINQRIKLFIMLILFSAKGFPNSDKEKFFGFLNQTLTCITKGHERNPHPKKLDKKKIDCSYIFAKTETDVNDLTKYCSTRLVRSEPGTPIKNTSCFRMSFCSNHFK